MKYNIMMHQDNLRFLHHFLHHLFYQHFNFVLILMLILLSNFPQKKQLIVIYIILIS